MKLVDEEYWAKLIKKAIPNIRDGFESIDINLISFLNLLMQSK